MKTQPIHTSLQPARGCACPSALLRPRAPEGRQAGAAGQLVAVGLGTAVLPMAVGLQPGTASGGHPEELKLVSR